MKLNRNIREVYNFDKMFSLKIPKEKRREYIESVYSCMGRLHLLPYAFNTKLDELSKDKIISEKAVSEIEKMFKDMILGIRDYEINNPMTGN